uniref:Thylakoid membrane protein TERCic-like isoform X1 n=1 Tax=Rhizophora mucronata TaxID=61149 RepID=A0A2P2L5H9_RHIMU
MRLASVVQHSVKAPPLKHDVASLRVSTISALKRTGVPFPHSHFSSSFAVARGRRGQFYPVASARGAEQEDDLSTSGTEGPTSWAYDDLDKVNSSSRAFPSVDKQEQSSQGRETYRPSVQTVVLCVLAAVAFGVGIGLKDGVGKATEFFTGYILEQSLSVDNLFVFVLIFKYFKVPFACQNRVLSYGIAGAVVFRLSLILLGTATLQRFEAVNLLLAVILLYSSFKVTRFLEGHYYFY